MTQYCVYQITCPHDSTESGFEHQIELLLLEYYAETKMSTRVGSFVHSVIMSIDTGGVVRHQNSTQFTIGADSICDALPVVIWFATKLRRIFKQTPVAFNAISSVDNKGYVEINEEYD